MSDSGLEKFILDKLEKLDDKLDQVREESSKLSHSIQSHEQKDAAIHQDVRDMADKFGAQLDDQCKALKEYNKQLEIHIEGVKSLKETQTEMWKRVEPIVKDHEEDEVVNKYLSAKVKSRIKWIVAIGTVAASITAILKLMKMF